MLAVRDTSMYISKEEIEEIYIEIKKIQEYYRWHNRVARFFKKLI